MKRLWKKPEVKISAAAVVVVGFALLGLWISSFRTSTVSFDFLNGRIITNRVEQPSSIPNCKDMMAVYSFEADFNDICAAADAELSARGFKLPARELGQYGRQYTGIGSSSGSLCVLVFDGHGRVTVAVLQTRLRSWPPQHLLYRLKMHWQASGRKKSRKDNRGSPHYLVAS